MKLVHRVLINKLNSEANNKNITIKIIIIKIITTFSLQTPLNCKVCEMIPWENTTVLTNFYTKNYFMKSNEILQKLDKMIGTVKRIIENYINIYIT